jgi:hypothetical protein
MKGRFTFHFYRLGLKKKKTDTNRLKIEDSDMINVPKLILLLKQTKLISLKEISVFKMIIKKMNKGQPISFKHKAIYNDVATRASVDPMSNSMPILAMTRKAMKRKSQKGVEEKEKKK